MRISKRLFKAPRSYPLFTQIKARYPLLLLDDITSFTFATLSDSCRFQLPLTSTVTKPTGKLAKETLRAKTSKNCRVHSANLLG